MQQPNRNVLWLRRYWNDCRNEFEMPMTPAQQQALQTARALLDLGHPLELVLANPIIPQNLRDFVRTELQRDANFQLTPARMLVANQNRPDWLRDLDRSTWYYWPALRQFLLTVKGWSPSALRSLVVCFVWFLCFLVVFFSLCF